jgi:hypothetical protein
MLRTKRFFCLCTLFIALSANITRIFALSPVDSTASDRLSKYEKSPWLIAPMLQSDPKLGTSFGAMIGYMHYFDTLSRPSIFAIMGQYTTTKSVIGGAFARMSFSKDHQRIISGLLYGHVNNDYADYLGTGVPLKSSGELRSFILRYTYRIHGNWFIGAQGLYQNFLIEGATDFDDQVLDYLGVVGYKSGGGGLVAQLDSRDNENSPSNGWFLNLNNMAYREYLGSDQDFDVLRADFRHFMPHGNGHVLAFRSLNHFTFEAPTATRAPVQLRSYKAGQYNDNYMSSLEAEERHAFGKKFTATVFLGVAYLYGDQLYNPEGNSHYFPAIGGGVQYRLKPKEGIVLNLEYAIGKDDNQGLYLKMGYAF